MKKIALVSLACAGLAAALPAFADDGARRAGGEWISVGELASRLEALGYTAIRDIERDDGRYEVEARNPEGRRVELKVSRKGDILRSKHDEDYDDRWDD